MKTLYVLLFALILVSCDKNEENCVNEIVGLYAGTCTSNLGSYQGDFVISTSATGDHNVLIKDDMLDGGLSTYDGTVSPDCKTITIPSQGIILPGNLAATINGSFQINGISLTGNLTVVAGAFGGVCSYNLTKR